MHGSGCAAHIECLADVRVFVVGGSQLKDKVEDVAVGDAGCKLSSLGVDVNGVPHRRIKGNRGSGSWSDYDHVGCGCQATPIANIAEVNILFHHPLLFFMLKHKFFDTPNAICFYIWLQEL